MATEFRPAVRMSDAELADAEAYTAYVRADFTTSDMDAVRRHQRWIADHSCDSTAGEKFDESMAAVEAWWADRD